MLDLKRLRLLRELHVRGTIAAVAAARNYSPSAVSQQLAQLERDAGTELLRKQGRRLVLTPAARVLVEHTEAILERLERAEHELAAAAEGARGSVRVVMFQSALLALLPEALHLLADEHPDLRVDVVQYEPEQALYWTSVGDFDLVVAEEYPGHAAPHHDGLDRELLTTDALVLAVPSSADVSSLADCARLPWVLEPSGAASRHWAEQQCRLAGFEPEVRFQTADLQAQARLVEHGHAVAFMNELTWARETPRMRFLPLPGAPRRSVFTAARRLGAPELVAVRDVLTRVARDVAALPSLVAG